MFNTHLVPESGDCLYAQYIREREGKEIVFHLETGKPVGYATYKWVDQSEGVEPGCYLVDIFVKESHRERSVAKDLADKVTEIATKAGKKWLYGSVDTSAHGVEDSLRAMLRYSFKFKSIDRSVIYFEKYLG